MTEIGKTKIPLGSEVGFQSEIPCVHENVSKRLSHWIRPCAKTNLVPFFHKTGT